jgi:hypothetical protein
LIVFILPGVVDFIYVPSAYASDTMVEDVLTQLNIEPPEIAFFMTKSWSVCPAYAIPPEAADNAMYPEPTLHLELGGVMGPLDHPRTIQMEKRLQCVLKGITEACAQTSAIFLLERPERGNRAMEALLKASIPGTTTLGLFKLDDFTSISPGEGEEDLIDCSCGDPRREKLREVILASMCDLGDDVENAVRVNNQWTTSEEKYIKTQRAALLDGGLVGDVSHVLVFESGKMRDTFINSFGDQYPTGTIMAGGTGVVSKHAQNCMKVNRPVFVFRGTGGAADGMAELFDFYQVHYREEFHALQNGLPTAEEEVLELEIQRRFEDTQGERWNKYYPKFADTARNFPEGFNEDSVLVVDMDSRRPLIIEQLQDDITRVMSCVYDGVPELGGQEAERKVLQHADRLQRILLGASDYFSLKSTAMQVAMRILLLASSVLALLQTHLASTGGHEESVLWLSRVNVLLPISVGIITSVYTALRPLHKFSLTFAAAKRMESEMYYYRTRAGHYSGSTSKLRNRKQFAASCEEIWTQVATSDVATGTITGSRRSAHQLALVFSEEEAADERQMKSSRVTLPMKSNRVTLPPFPSAAETVGRKAATTSKSKSKSEGNNQVVPELRNVKSKSYGSRLKNINADEYMSERIMPQLVTNQEDAPHLARRHQALVLIVIFITGAGSAVVAFGAALWLPALLAIVGLVEFVISYQCLESQLPNVNACTATLTGLLFWWDGLSLIQQRMPSTKDRLVQMAETAILLQHQAYAQDALGTAEDNDGHQPKSDGARTPKKSKRANVASVTERTKLGSA